MNPLTNQSLLRIHDTSAIRYESKLDSLGNDDQISDFRKETTFNSSSKKLLFGNIISDIKLKFQNKKAEKSKYN
jgi:hypothetical protein